MDVEPGAAFAALPVFFLVREVLNRGSMGLDLLGVRLDLTCCMSNALQ
jgi:hypothetical protein